MYVCFLTVENNAWDLDADNPDQVLSFWNMRIVADDDTQFSESGQVFASCSQRSPLAQHRTKAVRAAGAYCSDNGFAPFRIIAVT